RATSGAVAATERELSQVASRQEAASRAHTALKAKLERLQLEQRQVAVPSADDLRAALANYESLARTLANKKTELAHSETALAEITPELQQAEQDFSAERDHHADVAARLAALQALNTQLSEKSELQPWVEKTGLAQAPRLLNRLKVERGWERALETALRECLNAFEVGNLDSMVAFADTPPPARVAFIEPNKAQAGVAGPDDLAGLVSCTDKTLLDATAYALAGFKTAPDLKTALAKRATLQTHEAVVTPQGHCVRRHSLSLYAPDNEQSGMLERNQQIEALHTELKALDMLKAQSQGKRDTLKLKRDELQAGLGKLRSEVDLLTRKAHDAQLAALRLQEAQARADSRLEQLSLDRAMLESELEEQQALLLESEDQFAALDEKLAQASELLEQQKQVVQQHEHSLRNKQLSLQEATRRKQDAEFALRGQQAVLRECERDIQFAQEQQTGLTQRKTQAHEELEGLSPTQADAQLQEALQERMVSEERVAIAREALEQTMAEVSRLEKTEQESDKLTDPLRQTIQDCALKIQAAEMNIEQFSANLQEVQADLAAVGHELAHLEVQPKASVLQSDVTRLSNAMQELGAVNLAALDELTAAAERKSFLDQQAGDLLEAMQTLEDAIRKIDLETRDLLQATFNEVNGHFSRLFPALFGGGEARLVMSGEEILDAGVQVFAQPPGKKNGTIHLLSGGEKALTATALVFAIFELNPAPFCLLDEVDAPLDDANTERFTKLVKQMAERTQFLFISHNRIAMEMAQQLVGVTMQEKGVSRIVAVDLSTAEKLATETV
ncbi:MAG: AAA family ATPase, partial [Limnobacter sp.]|nr:AAA family ATPase [Limnobacter sp.]